MTQLIEDLRWRYSTKKFDSTKKISDEDFKVLMEVIALVPSSNGLQPYKFLVVENTEIRQKLREKSWNQSQVTDASHLIVMCAFIQLNEWHIDEFISLNQTIRLAAPEKLVGFSMHLKNSVISKPLEEMTANNENQVYIALGHLLHTAAQMRIDSSPMEGFQKEEYDEILGLKEKNLKAVVVCALGYRSDEDAYQHQKKVRKNTDDLFDRVV
jgi:nitroreductase/dihydropteridine reductase